MADTPNTTQEVIDAIAGDYNLDKQVVETFSELGSYDATKLINLIAGNGVAISKAELMKQLKIILSEWKETQLGVDENDNHELLDGGFDQLFTVYGLIARAGIQFDEYQHVVYSNLTKFDTTTYDVEKTKQKYLDIDVETEVRTYDLHIGGQETKRLYITVSAKDQTGSDGKEYPEGKWLKSHNFQEPKYSGTAMLTDLNELKD